MPFDTAGIGRGKPVLGRHIADLYAVLTGQLDNQPITLNDDLIVEGKPVAVSPDENNVLSWDENGLYVPATGGSGGGTYTFTQVAPSASWSVTHNLGQYPSVTVVDTGGTVIVPDVVYVSPNALTVNFGSPTSGKAYLN